MAKNTYQRRLHPLYVPLYLLFIGKIFQLGNIVYFLSRLTVS